MPCYPHAMLSSRAHDQAAKTSHTTPPTQAPCDEPQQFLRWTVDPRRWYKCLVKVDARPRDSHDCRRSFRWLPLPYTSSVGIATQVRHRPFLDEHHAVRLQQFLRWTVDPIPDTSLQSERMKAPLVVQRTTTCTTTARKGVDAASPLSCSVRYRRRRSAASRCC